MNGWMPEKPAYKALGSPLSREEREQAEQAHQQSINAPTALTGHLQQDGETWVWTGDMSSFSVDEALRAYFVNSN